MKETSLPHRYAKSLANHGYGHALYEPISVQDLQPGSCGYLNGEGAWNPVVRLDQTDELRKYGLGVCNLQKAPQSTRSWGPKVSSTVTQTKLDFKADASLLPAGIPVDIGALFQYEVSHDEGTILLTSSPVIKESLYHEEPFKQWVKHNARIIATVWPDVLTHGLYIVTSTHSTAEARMNILRSNTHRVAVGFNVGFTPVGEIAPTGTWYTASADSGWITVKADKAGDDKVVFFGGLYFRWPWGGLATAHIKTVPFMKWRGASEDARSITIAKADHATDTEDPYAGSFDIECVALGTVEHRLAEEPAASDDADDF